MSSKDKQISNLTEFVNEIKKIKIDVGHTLFFRGHADSNYKLLPYVFREKNGVNLLPLENEINKYVLREYDEFFPKNMSNFDVLSKMQHYGIPTRLLDITTNPLIALYFACEDKIKTQGQVLIIDGKNDCILRSDSEQASILASLAKLTFEVKKDIYFSTFYWQSRRKLIFEKREYELLKFNSDPIVKKFKQYLNHSDDIDFEKESWLNLIRIRLNFENNNTKDIQFLSDEEVNYVINLAKDKRTLIENMFEMNMSKFYEGCKAEEIFIEVKQKRPTFDDFVPTELNDDYIVFANKNDIRIKNQFGAFILFGLNYGMEDIEDIKYRIENEEIDVISPAFNIDNRINVVNKKSILKELAFIGISEKTMYPELENASEHIKRVFNFR